MISDRARDGLLDIYRDLDGVLGRLGAACDACGSCCHLVKWGHQLWLTHLELALLISECGLLRPVQKGVCPYLATDGNCTARAARALGCRIFYCKMEKRVLEELHERFFDRIVELASACRVDLSYDELLSSLERVSDLQIRSDQAPNL